MAGKEQTVADAMSRFEEVLVGSRPIVSKGEWHSCPKGARGDWHPLQFCLEVDVGIGDGGLWISAVS